MSIETDKLAPRGKRENELMAKPKVKAKPKAKPKITAKEKRAREYRRAFERVCDLLADGPKNSVKEITEDKKIGLSRSGFYKMLYGGGGDLVDRYHHLCAIANAAPSPMGPGRGPVAKRGGGRGWGWGRTDSGVAQRVRRWPQGEPSRPAG